MVRIPANRPPTHPGEFLREEFLKPLELTQTEFAARAEISRPHVNALLNGRSSVTPNVALRLERLFGVSAQTWLNMQLAWDLWHAQRAPAAKAIDHLKPIDLTLAHAS